MARRGRGSRQPKQRMAPLWDAPEVRTMAQEIIEANHNHLMGMNLRYCFTGQKIKMRNKLVAGKAEVVGGKTAAFAHGLPASQVPLEESGPFHLITITRGVWDNLDEAKRRALVDHELCHCGVSDKGAPTIWPHDVEEFKSIIDRHGLWDSDTEKFAASCVAASSQPALELDAKPAAPSSNGNGNGKNRYAKEFEAERRRLAAAQDAAITERLAEALRGDGIDAHAVPAGAL